jgi:protein-S-isoprenylcysteine O-methyltransferase Ste14
MRIPFYQVRETAKIVDTGPYAYVRHPLYSCALLVQLAYAGMFWSYAPLVTFGITALAFSLKIPVEVMFCLHVFPLARSLAKNLPMQEKLMMEDPDVGPSYLVYQQKVGSKLIPHIW